MFLTANAEIETQKTDGNPTARFFLSNYAL